MVRFSIIALTMAATFGLTYLTWGWPLTESVFTTIFSGFTGNAAFYLWSRGWKL